MAMLKTGYQAETIEVFRARNYTSLFLGNDCDRTGAPAPKLRIAVHSPDGWGQVQTITLQPSNATWFTFKTLGTDAIGAAISKSCALARYLEQKVTASPELELLAPAQLNIVCFRYRAGSPDTVNAAIIADLHEPGIAAPSATTLEGRLAIGHVPTVVTGLARSGVLARDQQRQRRTENRKQIHHSGPQQPVISTS